MYVAIEGVIGVGKTTLARLLQPAFNAEIILEVFEENPFLSDFYSDRERYAFQTQIFFLLSRYHQQRRTITDLIALGKNVIADYTFAKDSLFARINLKGDELDMYYKVHEALAEKIQKPDLLVYLQAATDTLMQRIAFRDRSPVTLQQLGRFGCVAVATALLMAACMQIVAVKLGAPVLVAKVVCSAVIFVAWTYPAQRRLVFKPRTRLQPSMSIS